MDNYMEKEYSSNSGEKEIVFQRILIQNLTFRTLVHRHIQK